MAGGSGERFWPLSRRTFPKQLLDLSGNGKTLLNEAVRRLEGLCEPDQIYIAAAPHLIEPINNSGVTVHRENITAEPAKRNTAGCLVWFIASLLAREPDAIEGSMLVVTADHAIRTDAQFHATVNAVLGAAESHQSLAVIGIKPDRVETGFGYVEIGDPIADSSEEIRLWNAKSFREKPDLEVAKALVASGCFLWNSGMFFWPIRVFLDELRITAPEHYDALEIIRAHLTKGDLGAATRVFEGLPNLSIDVALMEKSSNVLIGEASFDWDDLGTWDALDRVLPQDANGNVVLGDTLLVDSSGNVVCNRSKNIKVCMLGIQDLIAVAVDDVIMICPKSSSQSVKKLVESVREQNEDLL